MIMSKLQMMNHARLHSLDGAATGSGATSPLASPSERGDGTPRPRPHCRRHPRGARGLNVETSGERVARSAG